jgi:hypothetical protein
MDWIHLKLEVSDDGVIYCVQDNFSVGLYQSSKCFNSKLESISTRGP